MKIKRIKGSVKIDSSLSLKELGTIISSKLLGGLELSGIEKRIYDEVPAIFNELLGITVILYGYSKNEESPGYYMNFIPNFRIDEIGYVNVDLSEYLFFLFNDRLKEYSEIQIIKPVSP